MEARRLKSIERMLAIQSRIRSLAEWRHKAIEQQAVAAKQEAHALVASLNGDGVTDGLFVDMTAKRLHRVAIAISDLDMAASEQARRVMTEIGREKRTARLTDRLRKVQLRADQDSVLIEIIDSAQAKQAASLE